MAKEVDSIHLLSCAIEASLGNDFPAFAFRLPGEDGFYWGACEPDRLMTLAGGVFPERQEGFFFAPFEEGRVASLLFPCENTTGRRDKFGGVELRGGTNFGKFGDKTGR